ncbi:NADPH-dependent 2,4-dienoyl-CoA reductase/sulfur reductase-like enzyme [Dongia mobilis]|uniref:NADPH-dependent 2,4-dienoyl-CoA reductase/sulfur reductase-like enzyme n=1 Tax=Dongia mobilis TaxID=578943 RepID=A0A4R6WXF4_9PROT|nr:FAD/NAD(P)-binding oxidoreductase [Dongia mobilis]TDQ84103.1 NADPH-dependent 2,4-dienoyl-CoA reductase/sulfur reductase-like enzyme [Dongia mobilis]
MPRVLIVGASLGGLRAAEALRDAGFHGAISSVGAEAHPPYNRPPLSKDVLLGNATSDGVLAELAFPRKARLGEIDWRLGMSVAAVDLAQGEARLADGSRIHFDALIVATGLRPRRLQLTGATADRFVLRTLPDALALRARLVPGARIAIIGGGFIGCEVAASARRRGCATTVIEPLIVPMQRALGQEFGAAMQALHEAAGIRFRTGRQVTGFEVDVSDRLHAVRLDDDSLVEADLAVEAVGSQPNTEWLAGNGFDLDDGILCDHRMAAIGHDRVAAVGDVARFPCLLFDDVPRRVEHWSIPGLTARRAAGHVARQLGVAVPDAPFAPLPTFWSDQLGLRIQCAGLPGLADRVGLLSGSLGPDSMRRDGAVMGYWRKDRQVGVAAIGVAPQRFINFQADLVRALQNCSL